MLKFLKLFYFILLLFLQQFVLADEIEYCSDGTEKDPTIGCFETPGWIVDPSTGLYDLFIQAATLLLTFAGSIASIMLIYGGIQYALAMGDDEKIDTAKRNVKWSIFGLGISIWAYSIVEFVLKNIL